MTVLKIMITFKILTKMWTEYSVEKCWIQNKGKNNRKVVFIRKPIVIENLNLCMYQVKKKDTSIKTLVTWKKKKASG